MFGCAIAHKCAHVLFTKNEYLLDHYGLCIELGEG